MLGTTLPTPLYPIYHARFSFDALAITLIFAIYAFGVIAALLTFGRVSDTLGRKPVLIAGLVLSLLSAAVLFCAGGFVPMLVARVLSGISAGIFTGTASAYLIDLDPSHRSRAAAVAVAANIGGLGIGTLLAGLLAQYLPFPLQLSYAVDAALVLLAFAAVLLAPETVTPSAGFQLRIQRVRVPAQVRSIFVQAGIAGACSFAVAGLLSSVAPSFLSEILGVRNHAIAGVPIFAFMGTSAVGQLLLPRIARSTALRTAIGLLLAGVVVLLAAIVTRNLALLFIAAVVEGIGQGIGIGAGLAEINRQTSTERAEVNSAYFVVLYLGLSVPVIGLGILANATGLVLSSLVFCGLVGLTLVGVLTMQRRTVDSTTQ